MSTLTPHLKQQLKQIPHQPGVYLMKNQQGHVIYVGKAKVMANRVKSYFQRNAGASPKTRAMVEQIETIETVVTGSDLEALLLENNLIKKYRPKYNILLRDDKNYPMLRLPIHEPFPRLEIVRRMNPADKALYFGPYIPSGGLYEMMRTLRTLFPLPNCNIVIDGKAERPCIEFEIKRCLAPCTGNQSQADYQEMISGVRMFLEGKDRLLLKQLRQKMVEKADQCHYEEAARLHDQIRKIQRALEHQRITSAKREDQDVIAFYRGILDDKPRAPQDTPASDRAGHASAIVLVILFIRQGMVLGKKEFFLDEPGLLSDEEIVSQFVSQFYSGDRIIPPGLILPMRLSDQALLQKWLSERCTKTVCLVAPTRGAKKKLIDLALENAKAAFESRYPKRQSEEAALKTLQSLLHLPVLSHRIEGYDISNIMGRSAVGSMVVFEGGRPKKSDYRHFKIKTIEGANDFGMIAEVLRRRFSDLALPLPDLILIDGGRGQVSAAKAILDAAGKSLPLIGLAKEREDRPERVYRPEASEPMVLPERSPATHLLMQVRDEAHRFAVSYHRKVRSNQMLHSLLEEIPGIGKKRRLSLLRHFGSLDKIRKASEEDLEKAPSMNKIAARKLFDALQAESLSA